MENELDLLEEKRELAKLRITSYQQQATHFYNSKVKIK